MYTTTTNGIKVSVECFFQQEYSHPINWDYMFAYKVTIENESPNTVKLLKRFWKISDSCGENKEVEGVGVIGKQPVLKPGEQHQYISRCSLKSEIGKMGGSYLMQDQCSGKLFRITIPSFDLIAPLKLN